MMGESSGSVDAGDMEKTSAQIQRALGDLDRQLPGRVGRIGSAAWESARTVFAPAGRHRSPIASVRPADRSEVARVIAWAAEAGVTVSPRSGGHAFDGFAVQDDTILLDLRQLDEARLDDDGSLAVMPGVTNLGVAKLLGPKDLAVPVGDCPTVAFGGLVTGGGFGYGGRLFGLTCDHLVEATVALPDGSLVRATAKERPDLLWACRGGGGAAGVVTDFLLDTRPVPLITTISIGWPWARAREAFAAYAECSRAAPAELDLKLKLRTTGADRFFDAASAGPADAEPGIPLLHIDGEYIGRRTDAEEVLHPLTRHAAAASVDIREQPFHEAEARLTPLAIAMDPAPATIRPARVASDFAIDQIDDAGAEAIIGFLETLQGEPEFRGGGVIIEPSGGEIARTRPDAAAFVHRHATLLIEWEMFYDIPCDAATRTRHDDLLAVTREAMGGRLTGGRYVNYADVLDTPETWWGDNLARLRQIADDVDPERVIASRLNRPPARE